VGCEHPKPPKQTLFCASKHSARLSCPLPKVATPGAKPSESGGNPVSIPGVAGSSTHPQAAALLCSRRNPKYHHPPPHLGTRWPSKQHPCLQPASQMGHPKKPVAGMVPWVPARQGGRGRPHHPGEEEEGEEGV